MAYQFGECVIHRATNTLTKGDVEVRLEPKLAELLYLFAERSGEPLSRDTIRANIWPGVVVGDEVINRAVFKLRNVLADDPSSPTFIETIPKRGYRFLIPATALAQKQAPIDAVSSLKSVRRYGWIAAFIITAVIATLAFWLVGSQTPRFTVERVAPVTSLVGGERDFDFTRRRHSHGFQPFAFGHGRAR